jgi:hypothetical protein
LVTKSGQAIRAEARLGAVDERLTKSRGILDSLREAPSAALQTDEGDALEVSRFAAIRVLTGLSCVGPVRASEAGRGKTTKFS